jgi:aldose 1-epimerase
MQNSYPTEQLSIFHESGSGTSMASISATGGMLLDLQLGGSTLISSANIATPLAIYMGTVLAPWPNRLRDGKYELNRTSYQFENLDAQQNLNHGLVGDREFEVVEQGESLVSLGYEFGSDPGYPFRVDLTVRYELAESELLVTALALNNEHQATPFAIGFHPYFLVGEAFELTGDFSQHVLTDERMLPSGAEQVYGLRYTGGPMDDCYFGSDSVLLKTAETSIEIRLGENMSHFMFYRPGLDIGDSMLAIEPMSSAANIFADDIESVLLQPGELRRYSVRIRKQ